MIGQSVVLEPACVVHAIHASEVDRANVMHLLVQYGVVLFDGLALDVEQFEEFTDQFGTSEREQHPSLHGRSRGVVSGCEFQALHREFFAVPCVTPDLIWFYCQCPAAAGGATTIADGVRFLRELSATSRDVFTRNKLHFHLALPRLVWQKAFSGGKATLDAFVEPHRDLSYRIAPDGALHFECLCPAYAASRLGQQQAFVNPVMHALQYPSYYCMSLEDGQSIPTEVVGELHTVAKRVSVAIRWKPRNFAVIDNARVMHGREAFADPARRILARHAMARL